MIPSSRFPSTCDESDKSALKAADDFFDDVISRLMVGPESLSEERQIAADVAPALHDGVHLDVDAGTFPDAVLAHQPGVEIRGSCNATIDSAVRARIAQYVGIIGPVRDRALAVLALSAPTNATEPTCTATLQADGKRAVTIAAQTIPALWHEAGEDIGTELGLFYLGRVYGRGLQPPSRFGAFLLAGLPQLQDPYANHTPAWIVAGADLTLLAAAVTMTGLGLREHLDRPGSTSAGYFVNVGGALFLTVGLLRVGSFLLYSPVKPMDRH